MFEFWQDFGNCFWDCDFSFFTFGVEKDGVVFAREHFCGIACAGVCPNQFVAEVLFAEDGVEHHAEVGVGGWIAVEEEAAGFFEEFVALEQAGGHHYQVGLHAGRMHFAGEGAEMIEVWLLVVQEFVLFGAQVVHRPSVVKARLGPAAFRFGRRAEVVIVAAVRVEGRIGDDGVGDAAVQSAHDVQVIAEKHGLVLAIHFAHFESDESDA